jgi:hypothetical protein
MFATHDFKGKKQNKQDFELSQRQILWSKQFQELMADEYNVRVSTLLSKLT